MKLYLTPAAVTRRRNLPKAAEPSPLPHWLRPRFTLRRARAVGSPCWACTRCGGAQGDRPQRSPRFCAFGCDDAELQAFESMRFRPELAIVE